MTWILNKLDWEFWKSLWEIVEYWTEETSSVVKFTPFIDCGDTELKTEENSSVENWIYLSYDGYLC